MNKGLNRSIGTQLRSIRTGSNFTLHQLADLVGTSSEAIMGFEKGDQRVPPALLVTIAAELDVPISSFFSGLVDTRMPQTTLN